ncbi:hypothetical protein BSF38_00711 [Paludisphaera borealis]|uniref:Uncharacterized protein n=1 Tax=Paludisphaera borealis TaxID=1387353 RepID=A0A1U7CK28_9BACT|nr:hypothetical protein BSF38_00711 [Paludisphaera borealis]
MINGSRDGGRRMSRSALGRKGGLGEEVANGAVAVRELRSRRHRLGDHILVRAFSRSRAMAVHRRRAQDRDPVQHGLPALDSSIGRRVHGSFPKGFLANVHLSPGDEQPSLGLRAWLPLWNSARGTARPFTGYAWLRSGALARAQRRRRDGHPGPRSRATVSPVRSGRGPSGSGSSSRANSKAWRRDRSGFRRHKPGKAKSTARRIRRREARGGWRSGGTVAEGRAAGCGPAPSTPRS